MADDDDDYIFIGTPIEREEDTSARKRKATADAGQLRSLPAWKQDVRDEEGRRRFHGAFTGGFSAGYYNTVGSKEGWTPQTFTSSRKSRAETKKQSIYSFLDDEDMKGMGGHAIETSSQFDTFGFTAADVARKNAEKEQQKRPSAIPGPVPDELVLPAANSIGVKLLVKMGWRHGHAIKDTHADLHDARRQARKAFLAFSVNEEGSEPSQLETSKDAVKDDTERYDGVVSSQSTPVFVLHPKQDLHGLGYDPFKHAPEFRDRKKMNDSRDQSTKSNALANSGKYAPGFGIGALEELDVEDEDIYASGFEYVGMEVEEEEPSKVIKNNKLQLEHRKQGVLSGFKVASSSDYNSKRFSPPVIPPDFEPFHKFTSPLEPLDKFAGSPPPEVPSPEDNSLKVLIEGFATLVARCGKLFEDLSKEKNRSNPLFSFLSGGNGHQYYMRKLWEAKQKSDKQGQVDNSVDRKMTAESRGRILGEKPLERSTKDPTPALKDVIHLQSNLSETFTKPKSVVDFSERARPFKDDPAKQERFEQFLKDKYKGGLRSTYPGGTSAMSENDRARERLDFEAAAEAIDKGEYTTKTDLPSSQQVIESIYGDGRFVPSSSAGKHQIPEVVEETIDKICPKRVEFQWRPAPILCKRFDLTDPFMGKPPPPPRARSKLDTLIFMPDSFPKSAQVDPPKRDSLPFTQSKPQESDTQLSKEDLDTATTTTNVERPVDLYKAIFSDDSDEEEDNTGINNVTDSDKKIEGVNTTLNRLVAGDFLESLGKELGLEVPPDRPSSANKTDIRNPLASDRSASMLELSNAHLENEKTNDSLNVTRINSVSRQEAHISNGIIYNHADTTRKDKALTPMRDKADGGVVSDYKDGEIEEEKKERRSKKHRSHSKYHRHSSSSDTDSSSDHGRYDRSKSRSEKRSSSKRKSRKHLDHHSRKRSRSPARYSSRDKDQDLSDDSRKDRRSRDREKHARRKHH